MPAMGNLRDQLKKAKVISEKKARQLAHEERVHRKEVGHKGLEQEQAERTDELRKLQSEDRKVRAEEQQALDTARKQTAEVAACEEILRKEVVTPRARAGQRWYFELEDGALPWFEIDASTRFQLEAGAFWVVRTGPAGSYQFGLLASDHARRVAKSLPEVVAWAPRGSS